MRVVSWRKLRFRFDWTLSLSALAIVALGLLNSGALFTTGSYTSLRIRCRGSPLAPPSLWASRLDYRLISRLSYVFYGAGLSLLVGVFAFGKMVGGGRRWFDLGLLDNQPLGAHAGPSPCWRSARPQRLARLLEGRLWRHLAMPVLIVSAPASLIAKQPDFGTAFLILAITIMPTARLKPADAGRHRGHGRHRGLPRVPAPAARVPARASRRSSTRLRGRLPDAPGLERHRFGALSRQGLHARHADPSAALPGLLETDFPFAVGRGAACASSCSSSIRF